MVLPWRRWISIGLWALCALSFHPASAASLQVAPTRLELRPGQASEALWLTNTGSAPMQVQVRVFSWQQAGGEDRLLETRDIQASPPVHGLAAGQQQLVRLVRIGAAAPAAQQAYRVVVDELPRLDPEARGMQFVLRYSVPLFLQPANADALEPRLTARVRPMADGSPGVEVRNEGDGPAQLADVAIGEPSRPRILRPGLVGYVLPGQVMHWNLDTPALPEAATFSAKINGEPAQTPLPPTPPAR